MKRSTIFKLITVLYFPTVAIVTLCAFSKLGVLTISGQRFQNSVAEISASLAGFELAALSILLSMPDNKFTQLLRKHPLISTLYAEIGLSILLLLSSMLISIFEGPVNMLSVLFAGGIGATLKSSYKIVKIAHLSAKSK